MLTLDTLTSQLYREGVGVVRKSAQMILKEHEDVFWEKELLGTCSPRVLRLTVFYYVGLYFCLRDEEEQYTCTLVPEQFRRKPSDISVYSEDVSYLYHELISKNNQHRYKDINSKAKELKLM
jgi:hypothetical protein